MNQLDICKLLPHTGSMCLLDSIVSYNEEMLIAETRSHLLKENPLRLGDRINSIIGVEYAAQTMAVHATLMYQKENSSKHSSPQQPSSQQHSKQHNGYLATTRNIQLLSETLNTPDSNIQQALRISVSLLMKDSQGYSYEFNISNHGQAILSGKLTIFLIQ